MADEKISAMPAASALDGTELVPLVQGGGNVQGLISAIATYLSALVLTLTNKRTQPRVVAIADAATVTPDFSTTDLGVAAAMSQAFQFANPAGSPQQGERIEIWVTSATARAITYDTQYRGSADLALPALTSGSGLKDKFVYEWDSTATKLELTGRNFGN